MMLYVAKLHKKKILMAYAMKISKIIYIFAHPKSQPFIFMNLPKSYFISLFLKTVSYPINLGGANYE